MGFWIQAPDPGGPLAEAIDHAEMKMERGARDEPKRRRKLAAPMAVVRGRGSPPRR
jgi:hypothetical protein